MKTPEQKNAEIDDGLNEGPSTTRPPGGKVLQRLLLFEEERGLPQTLPQDEEDVDEKKPKKKSKKSIAPEETQDVEVESKEYAQALLDAAMSLQENLSEEASTIRDITDLSPPTAAGPNWRFLGPSSMPNGQTYGESRVVVSGRVAAIAIDPSNPSHILCGAAGGGVWESRTRGTSWSPRTDYMPTLTTGALAFDPTSPNIVYCGTGEGNFYWNLGGGVLRSTNGGTTWAVHATAPFVGQGFYDLEVDPANGNHLFAATTGGFYESTNGGATWTQRRGGICWDMAVHPNGGAGAEILAAFSNGVFRSVNGGQTWASVSLPGAPASYNRLAVSISRSNPAIAFAFGASGATAFLYRRNASGTWAQVTVPSDLSTGQAWYDWFLAVSPDNANQVYLGAIEVYRGTLTGSSWAWVKISNKAGDDIHPDQHAIAFDPTNANVIYVGNDGGMFTSPNRGTSWTSLNDQLGITEIEYLAQDYGSSRWLVAGTQDNGSIRYTGNSVWDHIADGDGGDCGVNRTDPNVVYHSYYNMGMERSTTKGNFGSFSWIGPNVPSGYASLFYPPMEVNNDTVAQAGQSVFASRNRGTAWTEIAIGTGQRASAMYIPDPDRIYVGTTSGRLFRINWSGSAWSAATELTSPRTGASMSDIHVTPGNLNRIWVTYSTLNGGRVFRSDNGGSSWTDCSAGLPNLPISAVEVHPGNSNRIWVAADVGVYQSLNQGGSWGAFSNGLPNSLAIDLLYHPHARVLRVGMRNRGVWEIPVDGWPTRPYCATQFTGTLGPNGKNKWFTFRWPATWHVVWTVMPTNVSLGAPQVTWNVQVERADAEYVTYWIEVTNLKNIPLTFEGRYAILSYY